MNMDVFIALIAAIGGLSGLVTAISGIVFKIIEHRKEQRGETLDAKLKPIVDSLQKQGEELRHIRLDTLRLQLMDLMHRDPANYDSILKVAEVYFYSGGDWYVTAEFKRWAKKQDVEIPDGIWEALKHDE